MEILDNRMPNWQNMQGAEKLKGLFNQLKGNPRAAASLIPPAIAAGVNINGLVDNDKFAGQGIGAAFGAGIGAMGPSVAQGLTSTAAQVSPQLGALYQSIGGMHPVLGAVGGALSLGAGGALIDKLRARNSQPSTGVY